MEWYTLFRHRPSSAIMQVFFFLFIIIISCSLVCLRNNGSYWGVVLVLVNFVLRKIIIQVCYGY